MNVPALSPEFADAFGAWYLPDRPLGGPVLQVTIGVGFYTRSEAAHLLRVDPETLRRWVQGYRYTLRTGRQRQKAPVVPPSLPIVQHVSLLSFVDLIELRVVRALIERGVSLQAIRHARALAQEHFSLAPSVCLEESVHSATGTA